MELSSSAKLQFLIGDFDYAFSNEFGMMFNSCFHLAPASQDRDILEVNCVHHIIRSIKIMKLCSHAIYM